MKNKAGKGNKKIEAVTEQAGVYKVGYRKWSSQRTYMHDPWT